MKTHLEVPQYVFGPYRFPASPPKIGACGAKITSRSKKTDFPGFLSLPRSERCAECDSRIDPAPSSQPRNAGGWISAHYGYPARMAVRGSWIEAIEHSLRKWIGLRPGTLREARIGLDGTKLFDEDSDEASTFLDIDSSSCALCEKATEPREIAADCTRCPLYRTLGHACDTSGPGASRRGPWWAFAKKGDPEPMIEALRKTLLEQIAVDLAKEIAEKGKRK